MLNQNINIESKVADKDIVFKANVGSSATTIATVDGTNGLFNLPASKLAIGGSAVTATAAELNIMDGNTSATSTTLVDADRVVVNDAGTMKQVALTDFETYMETSLDTLANVTTTVPAITTITKAASPTAATIYIVLFPPLMQCYYYAIF